MIKIPASGLLLLLLCASAQAQDRIYRCGNAYTNTVTQAQAKNCTLVEGGNVTVVQGTRAAQATAKPNTVGASARVASAEQGARDADARLILQAELKKAEVRQAELLKEYNNGAPDKLGNEAGNYQRYLDRVAELKASLARNESDMAGIRRELGRLPGSVAAR